MATRIPALIQLSDPRVAAQLVIIIATCWLAKTFSSRACESRQLDSSETEHNTEQINVFLDMRYLM